MVIISKGAIYPFVNRYPLSAGSLNEWFEKSKNANWRNFTDIKNTFNTVDSIGNDRYIFDIAGNNYRLIAMIHFKIRTVYIRGIFTHSKYDELNKKGKLTTL